MAKVEVRTYSSNENSEGNAFSWTRCQRTWIRWFDY
jgi:hypothetical protein